MFLFSATFFPLSTYPDALQWVVRAHPALPGRRARARADARARSSWSLLGNVAYLAVLGVIGIVGASRRIERCC